MLEPDSRVVLLDQLRPPPGYRLHAAVATTFTLDLTTAVVPPLAFASFEARDGIDPIAALEAVRGCTDRVDVFCQAGQISVPRAHSDLMAFLEPMVHPVRRPRPGHLFHPKVWFLHYTADYGDDRFRLLCSTRNLAGSHAWDAVVTLDGVAGRRDDPTNRPLSALVGHLPVLAVTPLAPSRRNRIDTLARAARRVQWERPENVEQIALHAWGVPRVTPQADFSGYRHLLVSPFCDETGLAHLTSARRSDVTLVSRPETLDLLPAETLGGVTTRTLDPLAVLGGPGAGAPEESTDMNDGEPPDGDVVSRSGIEQLSGLHAKVTVLERDRRAHVFIGSPNATRAAYHGNTEFAIELIGRTSALGVDTYLAAGSPFAELLVEYAPGGRAPDPTEELLRALQNLLRTIAAEPLTLAVTAGADLPDGAATYDLRLTSARRLTARAGVGLSAELMTRAGRAVALPVGEPIDVVFRDVALTEVTPFVLVRLQDLPHSTPSRPLEVASVLHANLVGDPPSRLDAVLARQVDTPEKFLRFLTLLLGLSDSTFLMAGIGAVEGRGGSGDLRGPGLFESVVQALALRPSALLDLDRLVTRLEATDAGRSVLPEGFEELWTSVRAALGALGFEVAGAGYPGTGGSSALEGDA